MHSLVIHNYYFVKCLFSSYTYLFQMVCNFVMDFYKLFTFIYFRNVFFQIFGSQIVSLYRLFKNIFLDLWRNIDKIRLQIFRMYNVKIIYILYIYDYSNQSTHFSPHIVKNGFFWWDHLKLTLIKFQVCNSILLNIVIML